MIADKVFALGKVTKVLSVINAGKLEFTHFSILIWAPQSSISLVWPGRLKQVFLISFCNILLTTKVHVRQTCETIVKREKKETFCTFI